jgi:eukaryotic-like serine/threonine-protein kinase
MDVGERYVLGRLVGEGATACVYEAEDTVLQREVAVKVFRQPDIGDTASERIDEETRILGSLAHPHLLPVFDSGRGADGHRFIVMPLVRGTTLARELTRGPLEPREVKRIGEALAGALAHIHERGIVHRDVKPSNVLLAEDGTPYLADFGFAHTVDGPALTATDCIVGTAGYLAPEQAEGLPVRPAVDVYALGLVLLEALTAQRAYSGTPLERATANALRPPGIPARLGPGWLRVLRTLTAWTPSARPAADGVGALLAEGEDVLPEVTSFDGTMELSPVGSVRSAGSVGGSASAAPVPVPVPGPAGHWRHRPAHRRRLAAVGAAAFTAVAVVGVGANMLTSGVSADTYSPSQPSPGAGAAGSRQSPAPAPAPATNSPITVGPAGATKPADHHVAPPPSPPSSSSPSTTTTKCQPGDAPKGNGRGKHKCGGDGGPGAG